MNHEYQNFLLIKSSVDELEVQIKQLIRTEITENEIFKYSELLTTKLIEIDNVIFGIEEVEFRKNKKEQIHRIQFLQLLLDKEQKVFDQNREVLFSPLNKIKDTLHETESDLEVLLREGNDFLNRLNRFEMKLEQKVLELDALSVPQGSKIDEFRELRKKQIKRLSNMQSNINDLKKKFAVKQ